MTPGASDDRWSLASRASIRARRQGRVATGAIDNWWSLSSGLGFAGGREDYRFCIWAQIYILCFGLLHMHQFLHLLFVVEDCLSLLSGRGRNSGVYELILVQFETFSRR